MTVSDFIPAERSGARLVRGPEGRVLWQRSTSPYATGVVQAGSHTSSSSPATSASAGLGCTSAPSASRTSVSRTVACWCTSPKSRDRTSPHLLAAIAATWRPAAPRAVAGCGFHAVRLIATAPKDRSNDNAYLAMVIQLREGADGPTVPDRAYDFHLKVGRDMGRGPLHYVEAAAYHCAVPPPRSASDEAADAAYIRDRAIRMESAP